MARQIKKVTRIEKAPANPSFVEKGITYTKCACCSNLMDSTSDPAFTPDNCGDCGHLVCEECRNDESICKDCTEKRGQFFVSIWS